MVKRAALAKDIISGLDTYCRKTNAQVLKKLAFFLGSKVGTNKTLIRNNIIKQAMMLEVLRKRKYQNGKLSVMSIDLGISNFAFTTFNIKTESNLPQLIEWNKYQLEEEFTSLYKGQKLSLYPQEISDVVHNLCEFLTSKKNIPDVFTIERQRTRSMSSREILEPILKVNVLEQVLFSNLLCKRRYSENTDMNYIVVPSDPQRMTAFWTNCVANKEIDAKYLENNNKLSKDKASSYQRNKTVKIDIVKRIIQASLAKSEPKCIELSPDWYHKLEGVVTTDSKFKLYDCAPLGPTAGVKKDDDLADSFLHGLAWIEWLKFYEMLYHIVMEKDGRCDQDILAQFNETIKTYNLSTYNLGK